MLYRAQKEITEAQYNRGMKNNGYLTKMDEKLVFTASELYGYGIYSDTVHKDGDRFYVSYMTSDSCD